MLKFLRKYRKKFKTACLTAALATCWQIGQAAKAEISPPPNRGDAITINFTGTVSPSTQNLSHLFLIYGTGYSSLEFGPWALKLGDFPAGQDNTFSVQGPANYAESLMWIVAGLYGDVSGGQYVQGVNGVTFGMNVNAGDEWNWDWYITEADAFNLLINDNVQNSFSYFVDNLPIIPYDGYGQGLDITTSCVLYNFSNASNNGQIEVTSRGVPEPVSIILFGTGGMIIVALRRRNQ